MVLDLPVMRLPGDWRPSPHSLLLPGATHWTGIQWVRVHSYNPACKWEPQQSRAFVLFIFMAWQLQTLPLEALAAPNSLLMDWPQC